MPTIIALAVLFGGFLLLITRVSVQEVTTGGLNRVGLRSPWWRVPLGFSAAKPGIGGRRRVADGGKRLGFAAGRVLLLPNSQLTVRVRPSHWQGRRQRNSGRNGSLLDCQTEPLHTQAIPGGRDLRHGYRGVPRHGGYPARTRNDQRARAACIRTAGGCAPTLRDPSRSAYGPGRRRYGKRYP